jgi:hypothetical protein
MVKLGPLRIQDTFPISREAAKPPRVKTGRRSKSTPLYRSIQICAPLPPARLGPLYPANHFERNDVTIIGEKVD